MTTKQNFCMIDTDVNVFSQYVNTNTDYKVYNSNDNNDNNDSNNSCTQTLLLTQEKYQRLCFIFKTKEPFIGTIINSAPLFTSQDLLFYKKPKKHSKNFKYIINLIKQLGVSRVDFLACELLLYNEWKTFFDILEELTSVSVGASRNKTGNISYKGDWILESTSENIKNVYFTNDILNYTELLDPILSDTDDGLSTNVSLDGSFILSETTYTTCNASSNGFIYFQGGPITTTVKPLDIRAWVCICPFGGNLKTTINGITASTSSNICTITWNCYSTPESTANTLQFSVKLYLNSHPDTPNRVDFVYANSESRTENFSGDYFIGYTDTVNFRYFYDTDNLSTITNGNSNIVSSNIFPQNSTVISDVLSKTPVGILLNANDGTAAEIPIGGEFKYAQFEDPYTKFNLSSNGILSFGEYMIADAHNPFSYSSYKVLSPFVGNLKTTNDGITVSTVSDICTITWHTYASPESNNILIFSIKLYLNSHEDYPNRIDYVYNSMDSQSEDFNGTYYIGYSTGTKYACCQDVDNISVLIPGASQITSTNIFPTNGSSIVDVLNIDLTVGGVYLPISDDDSYLAPIGGTIEIDTVEYTHVNLHTNGFIYFGDNVPSDITSPLINSDTGLKVFSPYSRDLVTTLKGITVVVDSLEKTTTIQFNCHNYWIPDNYLVFEIILYHSDHTILPNQVEYLYVSATSVETNELDTYVNIGFKIGTSVGSVVTVDPFSSLNSGAGLSTQSFPAFGTVYVINSNTIKWKGIPTWTPLENTSCYNSLTLQELNASTIANLTGTDEEISTNVVYKLGSINGYSVTELSYLSTGETVVWAVFTLLDSDKYVITPVYKVFKILETSTVGKLISGEELRTNFTYIKQPVTLAGNVHNYRVTISWINKNGSVVVMYL